MNDISVLPNGSFIRPDVKFKVLHLMLRCKLRCMHTSMVLSLNRKLWGVKKEMYCASHDVN